MNHLIEDMKRDLKTLIAFPSVEDKSEAGMPFGKNCYDALMWTLEKGKEFGFAVKNVDGYAGHIEFGSGEPVAVLCHLDVVPAGDGWTVPPYEGVEEDGKIYGRGATDNKGSVIACLYAMKALKDSGKTFKKSIRFILGCNEESGWKCMDYYCAKEQMPRTGFSPDADFPAIIAEKGVLHLEVTAPVSEDFRKNVLSLSAGERPNVVPAFCECIVTKRVNKAFKDVTATFKEEFTTLNTFGKMAHGSMPQLGENALVPMFKALNQIISCESCRFIGEALAGDNDGSKTGIACSDSESGSLTLNLGAVRYIEGKLVMQVDIRYPVTKKLDDMLAAFQSRCPESFHVQVKMHHAPLLVKEESELVQTLLRAYREVTGREEKPIAIGGGTYARVLPCGVAFGPNFPETPELAHQANEYIEVSVLEKIYEIYKRAMELLIS